MSWNLCNQLFKSVESYISNIKISFFASLTSAPGALVSMTLIKNHTADSVAVTTILAIGRNYKRKLQFKTISFKLISHYLIGMMI
jgi:hypothetical protein